MTDDTGILPYNLESEKVILGVVMLDAKAIHLAADQLKPADFYFESHRIIFTRMVDLAINDTPIDRFTLKADLERHGDLEQAGGIAQIASLTSGIPTCANLKHYIRIVKEKSISRSLIQIGHELKERAWAGDKTPKEILEKTQAQLLELYGRQQEGGLRSMADVVDIGYKELESRKQGAAGSSVLTGFADIDKNTGGLRPQNLIVLAARPSIGKSALACNIAINVARKGKRVAIFSLEMSQGEIYARMVAGESGLSCDSISKGYVARGDWPRIVEASGKLSDTPIWIDDSGSMSMLQMRTRAARLQAEVGLDLIVVDYLQQVQGPGKSIYERVTEVSRSLKILAKDLQVPVLALSQLHRLQSENDKPVLSDLRDSGAIEQDADMIWFMWRGDCDSHRKFRIQKQRNGPLAFFNLGWIPEQTKFINAAHESNYVDNSNDRWNDASAAVGSD